MDTEKKIPVILDTDIGADIDDTWALGMLIRSPELDVKYVISSQDDTVYKAKLIAKFLERCGRSDIPVGIGEKTSDDFQFQEAWVGDYQISDYPGRVDEDGIGGFIDAVKASGEKVTVIAIGPVLNIARALERAPEIAGKIKLVGVLGSIYRGHDLTCPQSEYNIRCHIDAAKKVFNSGMEIVLVPLDVTANIVLDGERYQRILDARAAGDPVVTAIEENFDAWMITHNATYYKTQSTCLYDTLAIYRAFGGDFVDTRRLPIFLEDDGFTRINEEKGIMMDCDVEWTDKEGFYDFLTARLLGEK